MQEVRSSTPASTRSSAIQRRKQHAGPYLRLRTRHLAQCLPESALFAKLVHDAAGDGDARSSGGVVGTSSRVAYIVPERWNGWMCSCSSCYGAMDCTMLFALRLSGLVDVTAARHRPLVRLAYGRRLLALTAAQRSGGGRIQVAQCCTVVVLLGLVPRCPDARADCVGLLDATLPALAAPFFSAG